MQGKSFPGQCKKAQSYCLWLEKWNYTKRQELVNLSGEPPTSTGSALLVLGCPQVPVQTSIALYLINRLKKSGFVPVVAGNKAANTLLVIADPDRHYLGEVMDLDRAVAMITDKKRDFAMQRQWVRSPERRFLRLFMESTMTSW